MSGRKRVRTDTRGFALLSAFFVLLIFLTLGAIYLSAAVAVDEHH